MQQVKEHIAFKSITLLITLMVLAPSAVKFTHIFTHHTHEVCKGYESTHIHKVDFDCDFHKFKLNNNYLHALAYNSFFKQSQHYKIQSLTYKFLNNRQPLSFSLRGPPH